MVKEFSYVPTNVSQACAYADLPGYNGARVPCKERAEHFMGIEPTVIGYCPGHYEYMQDIIKHEVWSAETEDHWVVQKISHQVVGLMYQLEAQREFERRNAAADVIKQRQEEDLARALANDLDAGAWVYFVQMGTEGPIKIGTSVDVVKRVASLSTASPYPLRIRAITAGSINVERAYHFRFREHRLSGEWFSPAPEVLDVIELLSGMSTPALAEMIF